MGVGVVCVGGVVDIWGCIGEAGGEGGDTRNVKVGGVWVWVMTFWVHLGDGGRGGTISTAGGRYKHLRIVSLLLTVPSGPDVWGGGLNGDEAQLRQQGVR